LGRRCDITLFGGSKPVLAVVFYHKKLIKKKWQPTDGFAAATSEIRISHAEYTMQITEAAGERFRCVDKAL